MAQALPVYAVAALLLVASVGPITRGVRDASLGDFEALDDPRPLDSFPFLKQVRPYLPPVVVEWLIVKQSLNLPQGGDFHVDDDGRIVVVWPDGCEEQHATYLSGSVCDDDPCNDPEPDAAKCGDPCLLPEDDPARPADCDPDVPPLDCDPGQTPGRNNTTGEPECIPDPKCTLAEDDPERPAGCPPPPPPEPPEPTCPDGHVEDRYGDCLPLAMRSLRTFQASSLARDVTFDVELTTTYDELKIVVAWEGLTTPEFQVKLFDPSTADENTICWNRDDGNEQNVCTIENPGPLDSPGTRTYLDAVEDTIAQATYTLSIDYEPGQAGGSRLNVELFGKPMDDKASQ